MPKNRITRMQAIELIKTELAPFVVRIDKACDTDPIAYRIFASENDEEFLEHGEFGYTDYSKPDVLLPRLKRIKEFLSQA